MTRRIRIEHGDRLGLLGELPGGWAQTCVTAPPAGDPGYVLAVLAETRRALRDDGTLWISLPRGSDGSRLAQGLRADGWLAVKTGRGGQLRVFAKQPSFLFSPSRAGLAFGGGQPPSCPRHPLAQPPGRRCHRCHSPRRAWCIPASGQGSLSEQTAGWCIAAATVPVACGACGAPYRRGEGPDGARPRWRASCVHHNDRGHCLLIDPFCSESSLGVAFAAARRGRAFLGIASSGRQARAIRRRLEQGSKR